MVQPCTVLVERGGAVCLAGSANPHPGPAANAVIELVGLDETLHLEEVQELFIEGETGGEVFDRQVHVRNAVKLHSPSSEKPLRDFIT